MRIGGTAFSWFVQAGWNYIYNNNLQPLFVYSFTLCIWDNPSHWLIFFTGETINQLFIQLCASGKDLTISDSWKWANTKLSISCLEIQTNYIISLFFLTSITIYHHISSSRQTWQWKQKWYTGVIHMLMMIMAMMVMIISCVCFGSMLYHYVCMCSYTYNINTFGGFLKWWYPKMDGL
jgi:hypothetical protein